MKNLFVNGLRTIFNFIEPHWIAADRWSNNVRGPESLLLIVTLFLGVISGLFTALIYMGHLSQTDMIEEIQENIPSLSVEGKSELLEVVKAEKQEKLLKVLIPKTLPSKSTLNEGDLQ